MILIQTDVRLDPNQSENVFLQSDFGLIQQDSENISLCVSEKDLRFLRVLHECFFYIFIRRIRMGQKKSIFHRLLYDNNRGEKGE